MKKRIQIVREVWMLVGYNCGIRSQYSSETAAKDAADALARYGYQCSVLFMGATMVSKPV